MAGSGGGARRQIPDAVRALLLAGLCFASILPALAGDGFRAKDPGMRTDARAGAPLTGLTRAELEFFATGQVEFAEAEGAADGLGPRMNLDNCGGCHAHPRFGGSSSRVNPQVTFGKQSRAGKLPSFVTADGPIRVVRFVRNADGSADGRVQPLFTIAGRGDAPGCDLAQPDFNAAFARQNAVFRIPTPVYGAGLIEQIPDSTILANQSADAALKKALGIVGRPSFARISTVQLSPPHGAQGPLARFGWKADNHSVLVAAAAAYQVEMGVSNEIFPDENLESAACRFTSGKGDPADLAGLPAIDTVQRYRNPLAHRYLFETSQLRERLAAFGERNPPGSRAVLDMNSEWTPDLATSIEKLAAFMRLLAPPAPSKETPGGASSIARGAAAFSQVGCALCHTPTLRTGNATIAALADKPVNLYSDLLLHDMGPGLADGISQGQAGPRDFRTAPLWGLGERIYLLHDGRTTDVLEAVLLHHSGNAGGSAGESGSEANAVVDRFARLGEPEKQDLLNFLRSL